MTSGPGWSALAAARTALRLINQCAGIYAELEISSPSDQPQGLWGAFAFMGLETGEMSKLTFVDLGASHTLSVIMFSPGML